MLASRGEDQHCIGRSTVGVICENLKSRSVTVQRGTLDELEWSLRKQHHRSLHVDDAEHLLGIMLELSLFSPDKHTRRRAMELLPKISRKGDVRVIDGLCPTRGAWLGLADEDEVVRVHAALALGLIAERGDDGVVVALLQRIWRPRAQSVTVAADGMLEEETSPDVRHACICSLQLISAVGDQRVQEAMLGILQRPRPSQRTAAMDTAQAATTEKTREIDVDEDLWAAISPETLQYIMTGRDWQSESLIRYRALRTLDLVSPNGSNRSRLSGGFARLGSSEMHGTLGDVENSLLHVMHLHQDDDLVFFGAFSALCRRLGLRFGTTCCTSSSPSGPVSQSAAAEAAGRDNSEDEPRNTVGETALVVRVLQAWLDQRVSRCAGCPVHECVVVRGSDYLRLLTCLPVTGTVARRMTLCVVHWLQPDHDTRENWS